VNKIKKTSGFTLLEVILALFFLSILVLPIYFSVGTSLNHSYDYEYQVQAMGYLKQNMHQFKNFNTGIGTYPKSYVLGSDYSPSVDMQVLVSKNLTSEYKEVILKAVWLMPNKTPQSLSLIKRFP
jgi:Tfp pilus assembly protein PilE